MANDSIFEQYHPLYNRRLDDWTELRDAYEGERAVKDKGDLYLPITSGQRALGIESGQPGDLLYSAYKRRAIFPDVVKQTVQALVGLMVREAWNISLPTVMEPMLENATARGESMSALIDRILENVILTGRIGLLLDVNEETNLPYVVDYQALKVINWDDNPIEDGTAKRLRMVVAEETRFERNGASLQWSEVKRFRLMALGRPSDQGASSIEFDPAGQYVTQVESEKRRGPAIAPNIRGNELDKIPFVFINSTDLVPEPGEVPMLGLGRLAMAIYRGEADYRQSLFMQGQDTLVLTGVANPNMQDVSNLNDGHVSFEDQIGSQESGSDVIVGAGAIIYLPSPDQDAKFIGVESKGLEEQRHGLENDYERASQFGMTLLTSGSEAEAAETLQTRVAGRTASLASMVKTSAAGLEQLLRIAAEWVGADPNDVVVEPNTDFIDDTMTPTELNSLIAAKMQGFPLSWRSIHEQAEQRGLTSRSLEEEIEEIGLEPDLGLDVNRGEEDGEEDDDQDDPQPGDQRNAPPGGQGENG